MIVLGLNLFLDYYGMKNSSVSLFLDGKLVSAISEDSLTGIKYGKYLLPINSLKYTLDKFNIKPDEIDIITFGFNFKKERIDSNELFILKKFLKNYLSGFKGNLNFIDHHKSHAYGAYYLSGFDKSGIIVMDGGGELDLSGFVGFFDKGNLNIIKEFSINDSSVGQLYNKVSKFILSGSENGEGTIMALAGYGKNILDISEIVSFQNDYFKIIKSPEDGLIFNFLNSKFGENYKLINNFQNAADLAYSLQINVEKIYKIIYNLLPIQYRKNICISGGCGLNINVNTLISNQDEVENIYIDLAPSDLGVSYGSALSIIKHSQDISKFDLGKSYSDEYILNLLEKTNIKYKKVTFKEIAEFVYNNNNILGFFTGGREFGERALGFRSIIGRTDIEENKQRINNLKGRSFFRPVAISILNGYEKDFFIKGKYSPTMSLNFSAKKEKYSELISGLHIDNTCRYQSVTYDGNPDYYNFLLNYKEISGLPCILNTSFNGKDRPIIDSPEEAIGFLFTTQLDGIVFNGKYLITK